MILSFSISCESNEESSKPPYKPPTIKHELEGTWIGYDEKDKNYELKFTVDSDGNITFYPRAYRHVVTESVKVKTNDKVYNSTNSVTTNLRNYLYTGKVKTNDIVYHYTTDVTCAYLKQIDDGDGKFVFSSPSNCTAKYDRIDGGNLNINITIITNEKSITTNTNTWGWDNLTWVTVEFTKQ